MPHGHISGTKNASRPIPTNSHIVFSVIFNLPASSNTSVISVCVWGNLADNAGWKDTKMRRKNLFMIFMLLSNLPRSRWEQAFSSSIESKPESEIENETIWTFFTSMNIYYLTSLWLFKSNWKVHEYFFKWNVHEYRFWNLAVPILSRYVKGDSLN